MVQRRQRERSLFEVFLPDGHKLWPDWLRRIDTLLEDEVAIDTVVQALEARWPHRKVANASDQPLRCHSDHRGSGHCRFTIVAALLSLCFQIGSAVLRAGDIGNYSGTWVTDARASSRSRPPCWTKKAARNIARCSGASSRSARHSRPSDAVRHAPRSRGQDV